MKNLKNFVIGLIALASFVNQSFAQETAVLKTKTKSNQSNDRTAGYDIKKNVKCRVIPTETGCTIVFDNVISTSSVAGISGGVVAGKRGYDYYKSMSCFSVSSADNSVSIVSPRDPASGLPTGKRMHKPITITKELDKSSPMLAKRSSNESSNSDAPPADISISEPGVQATGKTGGGSGKVSMSDLSVTSAGKATFKEFTITKRCDGKTTKISCPNPDDDCDISLEDCPDGSCEILCSWSWGLSQQGSSMSSSGSAGFVAEIKDGICTAMAIKEKPKMTQHK
jgi:Type VI secretion system effector, Hcp